MECTFQPNAEKKIKVKIEETVNKLYQDGVNKHKLKNEEKKEQPISDDFTFHPKVTT
jgi:hypothetical protein